MTMRLSEALINYAEWWIAPIGKTTPEHRLHSSMARDHMDDSYNEKNRRSWYWEAGADIDCATLCLLESELQKDEEEGIINSVTHRY